MCHSMYCFIKICIRNGHNRHRQQAMTTGIDNRRCSDMRAMGNGQEAIDNYTHIHTNERGIAAKSTEIKLLSLITSILRHGLLRSPQQLFVGCLQEEIKMKKGYMCVCA